MDMYAIIISAVVIATASSQTQTPPAGCTKSCPEGYLLGIYKTPVCTCKAEKCKEVCQDKQCSIQFSSIFGEYPTCGTAVAQPTPSTSTEQIVVGLSDFVVGDRNLDLCDMPAVTGRCRALIHRYFFDKVQQQCIKFVFGGCNGNDNNFYTKEECELRCLKSKASVPTASPLVGGQNAGVLSLYLQQLAGAGK